MLAGKGELPEISVDGHLITFIVCLLCVHSYAGHWKHRDKELPACRSLEINGGEDVSEKTMQNKDTTATVMNTLFKRYVMLSKLKRESLKKGQGNYRDGGWEFSPDCTLLCEGEVYGKNMSKPFLSIFYCFSPHLHDM